MPNENAQKIKLIKLYEMLKSETDEEHPISRQEVCKRLNDMGISSNVRTLSKDIDVLNEFGYEVMSCFKGREKYYYVAEGNFSIPEIKILMDSIEAANFITPHKSKELIKKVAALAGSYKSQVLSTNMISFNSSKHTNERIYYNIDSLEEALSSKKCLSFTYFDYDINCNKVLRHDGMRYEVQPVALVLHEDNYYLVCYDSDTKDNHKTFRVDRMLDIAIENIKISKEAMADMKKMPSYTKQVFKMFGGEERVVTLRFDPSLINVVVDKFGEDIKMKQDDDRISVKVKVEISPVFNGWVYQFGNKMEVID